ncbi:uncharacterized protein LOC134542710 [Bacillus rossius redtenbacheri]|uniref:uncharacterized protein LOC134542710 n=1 Tax=Bacillus rossius redtenbacheri TaxID=93214 RepID=UPI002FDE8469
MVAGDNDGQQPSTSAAPVVLPNISAMSQGPSDVEPDSVVDDFNNDFVEVVRAFNGNLRTFIARNNFECSLDICTYLEAMEERIVAQLTEVIETSGAIKFNVWLECNYTKPAPFDEGTDLRAFKTPNVALYNVDDIAEAIRNCIQKICREEGEYEGKGSGWSLTSVKHIQLRVSKLDPLRYHPERIDQRYLALETKFDFDGLDFSMPISQVKVFEKRNPTVSINVYAVDDKCKVVPLRVGELEKEQHFDLLWLTHEGASHYCLIKQFPRLVGAQLTGHVHSLCICKRCFKTFDDQDRVSGLTGQECLEQHRRYCVPHAPVRAEMPSPGKDGKAPVLEFSNYHYMDKLPIVIYCDFEAMLTKVSSCQSDRANAYTEAYQKHEPYSYGIYVKVDNSAIPVALTTDLPQEPIIYRGVDAATKFMQEIVDIGSKVKAIYETSVPITPLNHAQQVNYRLSKECCYCTKTFTVENYKVKDHNHISGDYIGAACNGCNLLRRRPKKLVIYFHNLAYDQHFIIKQLGYDSKEIFIIPHTEEKMVTFSKQLGDRFSVQFVDTFRFMSCGLASLAQNLPASQFTNTMAFFEPQCAQLVVRKCVFPYDYVDTWERLDERQLPPQDCFFNILTDSDISDADYDHAKTVWDTFKCSTLGEYSDVYLKSDVLIL